MNYQLPEKYSHLGFYISNLSERTFALKYHDNTILVFNSDFDLQDDFVDLVCDSYYRMVSDAIKDGLRLQKLGLSRITISLLPIGVPVKVMGLTTDATHKYLPSNP